MRISRNSTLGFVEILAKCRKKKKKKKNFGADRDLNRDRQIGNQVYIPRDHRASYKFMWFHYYIYHRVDEIRRKKYLASTRIWTRDSWLTTRYSYPETRGVVIEYSLEFNIWIVIYSAIASISDIFSHFFWNFSNFGSV